MLNTRKAEQLYFCSESIICWFTSQTAVIARALPELHQQPGASSSSPTSTAGLPPVESSSAAFSGHLQRAEWEIEQPWCELASLWDGGIYSHLWMWHVGLEMLSQKLPEWAAPSPLGNTWWWWSAKALSLFPTNIFWNMWLSIVYWQLPPSWVMQSLWTWPFEAKG